MSGEGGDPAGEVALRHAVEMEGGVLVVYDAATPVGMTRARAAYLAWWRDYSDDGLYLYSELIHTEVDVQVAVQALVRDLDVDDFSALEKPGADRAPERGEPGAVEFDSAAADTMGHPRESGGGTWQRFTRAKLLKVSGLSPEDFPSAAISGEPIGPEPPCNPQIPVEAKRMDVAHLLLDPPPRSSPDFLMGQAMALAGCDCTTTCCRNPCACSNDPCCDDPCCGDPDCTDPCRGDDPCCVNPDCCNDPCCGDPCCHDRCCQEILCCEDPDPCCDPLGHCCGNSDRCCNPDNPCCGSVDPCCNVFDPCCGNPDRCCNEDNPCCGSPNSCCNPNDNCCGNPDPCCNSDNPCCGSADPCCGSGDPCCGSDDPCCGCESTECVAACCDPERFPPCLHDLIPQASQISELDAPDVCPGATFSLRGVLCNLGPCHSWFTIEVEQIAGAPTFEYLTPPGVQGLDPYACELRTLAYIGVDDQSPGGVATIRIAASHSSQGTCGAVATVTSELTTSVGVDEMLGLRFANVSDADEIDPGGFLALNDDDDNNNQIPDKDEAGPVAGEDDLQPLVLTLSPLADPTRDALLDVPFGSTAVRFYESADKSDPVSLPLLTAASNLPSVLYVEGRTTSAAARDIELVARYWDEEDTCDDRVKLTVVKMEIKLLQFESDHDLMLDNNTDFDPTGNPFAEPEWWPEQSPPRNHPISQSMDTNIVVSPLFSVLPIDLPSYDFVVTCTGPQGFNFDNTVALDGGLNPRTLTSTDALERKIQVLTTHAEWVVRRDGITFLRQKTGPHKVYVTMGTPRDTSQSQHVVTQKRMERAIAQAGAANPMNPHEIVKTVIQAQGFNLNESVDPAEA